MECNVITMKSHGQEDTLAFLAMVQSKLEGHLGIEAPWEELLTRSLRYADVRLSSFIQEYLNPRVGVVSFSTDILVPTMWAHYARNTGIVVGYDTAALSALGFELRPVVYSELAPIYEPQKDDAVRLNYVDREHMERELRTGQKREGTRILVSTNLAEFGTDWKSLARLLLVKGMSWAYEKEVRLLVELEQASDIGKDDTNGWPIRVIEPPPEAKREIYGGANTRDADVDLAVQVARGENKKGYVVSEEYNMRRLVVDTRRQVNWNLGSGMAGAGDNRPPATHQFLDAFQDPLLHPLVGAAQVGDNEPDPRVQLTRK